MDMHIVIPNVSHSTPLGSEILSVAELGYTALVSGNGILCGGDGTTDNDIVGAYSLSLGRGHNTLLITNVSVGKTNTGGNGEELLTAGFVNLACLKR